MVKTHPEGVFDKGQEGVRLDEVGSDELDYFAHGGDFILDVVAREVVFYLRNQVLFPLPKTDLPQEVSEVQHDHFVHELKAREGVVLEEGTQVFVLIELEELEAVQNAEEFEHVGV